MKTKKIILRLAILSFLLAGCLSTNSIYAQIAVTTDGTPPDASAMLEVKSTEKGFLLPRMTQAQIQAIENPADGLMVYNLDDHKVYIFIITQNAFIELVTGPAAVHMESTYTIGSGGSCANTMVNGLFFKGIDISSNYVSLDVQVTVIGNWSISTDLVNGYSFSGNGVFTSTGTNQVNLYGSGIPVNNQTDMLTATSDIDGSSCTFSVTIESFECGDQFTDGRNGQSYNTTLIGNQCWMSQNMNYESTNSWCYSNSASYCNTYGRLYSWDDAMAACPDGWRLPDDDEWKTLEMFLGMSQSAADATSWRGTDEGGKLKSLGGWYASGNGTDNYNFTARGGGYRSSGGSFNGITKDGVWWTATLNNNSPYYRYLNYGYSKIFRSTGDGNNGYSVRCLKD
jgi:uncharacterized protein (TIGR02145 family)